MQTLSSQPPNHISQQTRKIAVFAILLFAIAGLVSGFAVGAFVHPKTGIRTVTTTTRPGKTPVTQSTKEPVSTTLEYVNLGSPVIENFSYLEVANGSTGYTFSSQIIDRNNKPIQVSDVLCKLWLTKDGNVTSILEADQYALPRAIDNIHQPFPGEVTGALNFTSPTQQTQPCTPDGKTTWSYTVSPSVHPGTYYVVILNDWQGKSFGWSWQEIKIKKN